MAFLIATPERLAFAASSLEDINSTLSAANAAATAPTTGILAAAADEVSDAIAELFNTQAFGYQLASAQASAFHARLVTALTAGADLYASAEAGGASSLQNVGQQLANLVNVATGRGGGPTAAADSPSGDANNGSSGATAKSSTAMGTSSSGGSSNGPFPGPIPYPSRAIPSIPDGPSPTRPRRRPRMPGKGASVSTISRTADRA